MHTEHGNICPGLVHGRGWHTDTKFVWQTYKHSDAEFQVERKSPNSKLIRRDQFYYSLMIKIPQK